MNEENILIQKLNEFIRKYYKNKAIRGSLISVGILVALFLTEILLEYFSYFSPPARIFLFYFYLSAATICMGFLVLKPVLKMLKIGRTITYEQAAVIIGKHFEEVRDKLLNTLQLINQKSSGIQNVDLLIAGINQKIKSLKVIPFTRVINFKGNLRYLKFALPPLFILSIILLISPSTISDPTKRIISYSEKFQHPASFRIIILNKEMKSLQQDDFLLRIKLTGDEIPEEIYVKTGDNTFQMQKANLISYSYLFKSLQGNTRFRIIAGKVQTEEFEITVYPKPIILNFETALNYPPYTGKQPETLSNIGDLVIPEGTNVNWKVFTRDVDRIKFRISSKETVLNRAGTNVFEYSQKMMESSRYQISQENEYTGKSDSLSYNITVIKDAFPEISMEESRDTTLNNIYFFKCSIKDDYGFSKLLFTLLKKSEEDSAYNLVKTENIPLDKRNSSQICFYSLDLSSITLKPGERFSYFFEIWDNDGIHGPKSTRTQNTIVEIPSLEKLMKNADKNAQGIQNDLKENINASKEIQKQIEDLNKRMVDQSELTWREKKKLEEILKENERIQKNVEELKKKNEQNIENEKKYLETSERILEKQKKLNELAEKLLTDEMKKSIEEMKKLLETMDKNKLNDLLPKLKNTTAELEKQLDRNLELFKQLEFERQLEKNVNQLNKLAEQQKKLSEKSENKTNSLESIKAEQEKIHTKYDSIKQDINELQKQEKELETAPDLSKTQDMQNSISEKLNKSDKLMKPGKESERSNNQKQTADEMKKLSQQMEDLMAEAETENQEEDAQAMMLLIEKLNKLSFEQEEIIVRSGKINRNDPKFLLLINDEKEISEKFKTIEDTLNKIAKRQIILNDIIIKQVKDVKDNINSSVDEFVERRIPSSMTRQQFAMTAVNNLAVLLDEVLQQMNEEQSSTQMSNSKKSCNKPKTAGGKQSMKTMRKMQQNLNNQLQDLKNNLGKAMQGQSQNRNEQEGENKEIAKMVAEQEAIRQQMQEYENELKEEGIKDNGNINQIINEMEKNESDLLNKTINQETFYRQQRIISRMLESERAEQMREKEEKRESREGNNQLISNPAPAFKYNKDKGQGKDVLNLTPVPVNYYYKEKASEYILRILK